MPCQTRSLAFLMHLALPVLLCWSPAHSSESYKPSLFKISQIADDTGTIQFFPILVEAYRRLGIEIIAEPLPAERGLRETDSGQTDGETVRVEGLEALYPNLVRVPESVVSVEVKVFTTGLFFPIMGWESMGPYSVCYMHGLKLYEQGTHGMRRVSAFGQENAVKLLREGLCEVAALSANAWIVIDRLNAGPMRELESPVASYPLYHYVHRRHADLVPLLAKELREMKREGVIDAILAPHREAVRAAKARQSFPLNPHAL
jgi:polar amino acid transport system substrate-binding protein